MSNKETIQIFEDKQVRIVWNVEKEKWYISIVDVISVLTESIDPSAYWRKLKQRLKAEGNKLNHPPYSPMSACAPNSVLSVSLWLISGNAAFIP